MTPNTKQPKAKTIRKTYPASIVDELRTALQELRETEQPADKELSAREAVAQCAPAIKQLLDDGYSAEQVIARFSGRGFSIAPLTLVKAVRQATAAKTSSQKLTKKGAKSSNAESVKQPINKTNTETQSQPNIETPSAPSPKRHTDPSAFVKMPADL